MDTNTLFERLTNFEDAKIAVERNVVRQAARKILAGAKARAEQVEREAKMRVKALPSNTIPTAVQDEEKRLRTIIRLATAKREQLVQLYRITGIPSLKTLYSVQIGEVDCDLRNAEAQFDRLMEEERKRTADFNREATAILDEAAEQACAMQCEARKDPTVVLAERIDQPAWAYAYRLVEKRWWKDALAFARVEDMPGLRKALLQAIQDKQDRIAAAQEIIVRMAQTRDDVPDGAKALIIMDDQIIAADEAGREVKRWAAAPDGGCYPIKENERRWRLTGSNVIALAA